MPRIVEFRTDPAFTRRAREIATIAAMVSMYCRGHHSQRTVRCSECASLLAYASRRTERCVFGDAKQAHVCQLPGSLLHSSHARPRASRHALGWTKDVA